MPVTKDKIEHEIGLTVRELEVIQLRVNALSSAIPPKEMQLTVHLMDMLVQQLNELKLIIERNRSRRPIVPRRDNGTPTTDE